MELEQEAKKAITELEYKNNELRFFIKQALEAIENIQRLIEESK